MFSLFANLQNGAVSPSMNIENAWNKGKTGKNVLVGVVDDGIYMTHTDIDDNIVIIYQLHLPI